MLTSCNALHFLLYRQSVGILKGTKCSPLVACRFVLFFCYERDFILSLSDNNQAGVDEEFQFTPIYLDDLLNIDKGRSDIPH